jgi:DNA repair exonuclease SbcCD ATPase subunit
MQLLREIRRRLEPLLEPAPDPRGTLGDLGERQRQLLDRVQEVRAAGAATHRQLDAKIAQARVSLDRATRPSAAGESSGQPGSEAAPAALRDELAHELHLLEEELRALDRDESALPALERRLRAELEALRMRQEVADARSSTREAQARVREALEGIADELAGLSGTLEQAERRTSRLHERAAAIDELTGRASAATGAGASARWLARRFELEAEGESMAPLRAELEAGRAAAERLATEHERLLPSLAQRRASDPAALASVPSLVDESYSSGMAALESALELTRAARSVNVGAAAGSVVLSEAASGLRGQASELIGQAERCGASLERARLELASISASGSAEGLEVVTRTLLAALDRARAVQEQLREESADRSGD